MQRSLTQKSPLTMTEASGRDVNLRRLGKTTLLAAMALILISVTLGYIAIGTLVRLQQLSYATTVHLDNWRYVANRTMMLLQLEQRERDPTPMVGLAREHFLETYEETQENGQIVTEIANDLNTPMMRALGFFDHGLLNEFIRSDIDPELRGAVRDLAGQYLRPGEARDVDNVRLLISLQNGEFLTPLLRRASLAGVMSQQGMRPLVMILIAVGLGVVIALWLIWSKSFAPAFVILDQKTRSLQASTDELASRNEELSRRNAQILAAQRMAHICYWFRQNDGEPKFSPGFTDVLGLREEELPPTLEASAALSEGTEAQAVLGMYHRLSDHNGSEEITRTIRSRDLGDRVIRERIESWQTGDQRQMMGIMIDISDLARASEAWSNAERIELVELVAAGVAHDFNNILNIISGHAEVMLTEHDFSPRHASAILDAVQTAAAITGQLRARVSFSDTEPSSFAARQVVRDCMKSLSRSSPEGPQIVMRGDPPFDFALHANRGLFENAIVNVLSNAREASEPGQQVEVALDIIAPSDLAAMTQEGSGALAPAPAYGRINVIDHGHGMSEVTRKRAVEPFFSTKERGAGSKGRGLGLWSVFSFVQSLHGSLSIASREGAGTTVSLTFPLIERADKPERAPESVGNGHLPQGKRVLVVEDEAHLAKLVVTMLEATGYQPVLSQTPQQAIAAAQQQGPFDFLFADVNLGPGMTGIDVANQLLQDDPDLKVVITSGFLSRADFDDMGTHDWRFLPKPYKLAQLRKVLTK